MSFENLIKIIEKKTVKHWDMFMFTLMIETGGCYFILVLIEIRYSIIKPVWHHSPMKNFKFINFITTECLLLL